MTSPEGEISPEWQALMTEGIKNSLENYALFFEPSETDTYTPLNITPLTLTEGADEREFHELSPREQQFVKGVLFRELGIEEPETIAQYEFTAPEGQTWEGIAHVNVFTTARAEEDMFVHEVNRPDNTQEYLLAPQAYRL